MTITRRGFMKAILAAGAAPAVVGSGILMPVKAIWRPEGFELPTGYRGFIGSRTIVTEVNLNEDWYAIVAEQMALEKERIIFNVLSGGPHNNRIAEALSGGRPLPWKDIPAHFTQPKT